MAGVPGSQWDECFEVAKDLAMQAGKMVRDAFLQDKVVETKANYADLVTETDCKVEELIVSQLGHKFPTHKFIGEEMTSAGAKCLLTDDPTWLIDPIDGTNNFVHKFPFVAISIGLLVNKQSEVAIVYNPIQEELYTARRGRGSFLNGQPLRVTCTEDISKSLLCTEFGSSRETTLMDAKVRCMRNVCEKAHGLRCLGSAACNMSQVAAGRVDGYFECGMHCWDIAAGWLLITEAGGVVIDYKGGPLDIMSRRVVCAGTEKLAHQIAALLEDIVLQRD